MCRIASEQWGHFSIAEESLCRFIRWACNVIMPSTLTRHSGHVNLALSEQDDDAAFFRGVFRFPSADSALLLGWVIKVSLPPLRFNSFLTPPEVATKQPTLLCWGKLAFLAMALVCSMSLRTDWSHVSEIAGRNWRNIPFFVVDSLFVTSFWADGDWILVDGSGRLLMS